MSQDFLDIQYAQSFICVNELFSLFWKAVLNTLIIVNWQPGLKEKRRKEQEEEERKKKKQTDIKKQADSKKQKKKSEKVRFFNGLKFFIDKRG